MVACCEKIWNFAVEYHLLEGLAYAAAIYSIYYMVSTYSEEEKVWDKINKFYDEIDVKKNELNEIQRELEAIRKEIPSMLLNMFDFNKYESLFERLKNCGLRLEGIRIWVNNSVETYEREKTRSGTNAIVSLLSAIVSGIGAVLCPAKSISQIAFTVIAGTSGAILVLNSITYFKAKNLVNSLNTFKEDLNMAIQKYKDLKNELKNSVAKIRPQPNTNS